jgi:dipeptidyl aminopeptidase/acylaminoacyl peptidase
LELVALFVAPSDAAMPPPGLLYCHGGCSIDDEDFDVASAFVEAGFAVLMPTRRGEHGNPGSYELFFGEVDDARAAAEVLRWEPRVDRTRLGYSMGARSRRS